MMYINNQTYLNLSGTFYEYNGCTNDLQGIMQSPGPGDF